MSRPPRHRRRAFVATAAALAFGHAHAAHRVVAYEAPVGAGDVAVLGALLAVERATLAAYRHIAACGLVAPARLDAIARHAADHRAHAELFAATIVARGGSPAIAATDDASDGIASEADALDLAARVELAGANACLRMLPSLGDRRLAKLVARVAADEAMHWATVNAALRRPAAPTALWFGA